MPLSRLQKARIGKYCDKADRGGEPVFVGREELFATVARNARAAANGDMEGRTVCLAGPPGVGKTAFLRALAERAPDGSWGGPSMACVAIDPDDLQSPAHVLAEIAWGLPEAWRSPTETVKNALGNLGAVGVSVGAGGFSFSLSASRGQRDPRSRRMPWAELPAATGRMPSGAVLCLLVDEAHGLSNTLGENRNILLRSLHMGPSLLRARAAPPPVFAVLAGHTQTPKVLEPSISQRYATGNLHYMGGLSHEESISYALGTLRHLQGDALDPDREALAHWMAGECGGFPHHLRNAMESVAEGMLASDSLRLSDLDGEFVAHRLRERRNLYYEARAEGAISIVPRQLGALLRVWSLDPNPVAKVDAEDALDDLLDRLAAKRRTRMAEMGISSGRGLMEEMIRRGAVMHDRAGGGCRCPIDSMIGWLESGFHAGREPFPDLAGVRRKGASPLAARSNPRSRMGD